MNRALLFLLALFRVLRDRALLAARLVGDGVRDLLFPRLCFACGAAADDSRDPFFCRSCARAFPRMVEPACPRCGHPAGIAARVSPCAVCRGRRLAFDGVVGSARYEGLVAELIPRFKFHGDRLLCFPLGEALAVSVRRAFPDPRRFDRIVPVPLTPSRARERGYNQAWLLAMELGRRLGWRLDARALRRIGTGPHQTSLSRTSRLKGPRGAFVADPRRARGRKILLVDDVLTTGATASEAARVLKAAGASEVWVAVAARATWRAGITAPDAPARAAAIQA